MFSVYVASPYSSAGFVRNVHETLRSHGMYVTSTWAEHASGPEDFGSLTAADLRAIAASNDRDLRAADVILVIDHDGSGRETYGELRVALEWGHAAVFVGRPNLSAWRAGVVRAEDLDEAIGLLAAMRDLHATGKRGLALTETDAPGLRKA